MHEVEGRGGRLFALLQAAQTKGPIFWILPAYVPEGPMLWGLPQGMAERLHLVRAKGETDLLWATEEALRSANVRARAATPRKPVGSAHLCPILPSLQMQTRLCIGGPLSRTNQEHLGIGRFVGMVRRLLSIWFPRLASDQALRRRPCEGPFALTLRSGNTDHLHCVNRAALALGLVRGMALADARAICPDLSTRPADLQAEAAALETVRRWAVRYAPMVAADGPAGLIADVTGVGHLFGGEGELRADLHAALDRMGLTAVSAIAETRGAAHALARHGAGCVIGEAGLSRALGPLPVAALRIDSATAEGLARLGLSRIADLMAQPRAPLARRFGPDLMYRLDQMLGTQPEPVAAPVDAPHFGVRMTLPEPIGRQDDVMAGLLRLLDRL